MCRELYVEVKRLMKSSSSYLRQKAVLAAIRIIKNIPDTIDDFLDIIETLIEEKSHSVLMATLTLICQICHQDQSYIASFKKYTPFLIKALKNLLHGGYAPEYDISNHKDPFLQVRFLQVLRILGAKDSQASDEMNDILAQIATNTEGGRNTGNQILYECTRTIMGIESNQGLRGLGVQILSKFIGSRENNFKFIGLKTLQQVVDIDYNAVQKHKATITECLKDHDMVIKLKALDLLN